MSGLETIQENFQIDILNLYCGVGADYVAWCYPRHWGDFPHLEMGYYLGYGDTPERAHSRACESLQWVMDADLTPWHSAVNAAAYVWVWHILNNDPIAIPEFPPEIHQPHWLEEKLEADKNDGDPIILAKPRIIEFAKLLKANLRMAIALRSFDVRETPPDIILESGFMPAGLAAISDPGGVFVHPFFRVVWVEQDAVSGQVRDFYQDYWKAS